MNQRIPIKLTVRQWNSLMLVARGELESLADDEYNNGYDELADAVAEMLKWRTRWASGTRSKGPSGAPAAPGELAQQAAGDAATPSAIRKDAGPSSRSPNAAEES